MTQTPTYTRSLRRAVFGEWFVNSASAGLLAYALAIGWCNLAHFELTPSHDPLTGLSLNWLFWLVAGLFAAVSCVCLGVRSLLFRVLLVGWLAVHFEVYLLGLHYMGSHAMLACFRFAAPMFGVPCGVLVLCVEGTFLYLLAGSLAILLWLWHENKQARALARQMAAGEMVKNSCPACGGHVVFSATNLGQQISCPHCQANVTLRGTDNLKMSCYFCKEHIEFPAHAIGTKMACPHCKREITLKEPI